MSLYNAICGFHPYLDKLLAILNLRRDDIYRLRDCHLSRSDDGGSFRLVVLSRVGTEHNPEKFDAYKERITKHPRYMKSRLDPDDSRFFEVVFDIPEIDNIECQEIWQETKDLLSPRARFMRQVKLLQNNTLIDDPRLVKSIKVGRQIISKMEDALRDAEKNNQEEVIVELVDSDLDGSLSNIPGRIKIVIYPDGTVKRVDPEQAHG